MLPLVFFFVVATILATVMLMAMATETAGLKGAGARYSRYVMAASTTITKGESVALDSNGKAVVSPTTEHLRNVGTATETKTSGASGTTYITVIHRGLMEITAKGAISAGDKIRNSQNTAGQYEAYAPNTQATPGSPTAAEWAALQNNIVAVQGHSIEDIADGATGIAHINVQ